MTDLTFCYLHMTSARIAAMDFFDELDETSSIGKVDEDEIEIPIGAMPPDPDDGDNLPSQIHPSFPYGNPFKEKTLIATAFTRNGMSTRALYEDAEFEGVGRRTTRRWKDLGLDVLLPPDPVTEEEAKAKAARNSVHTSSRRVEPIPDPEGDEGEEEVVEEVEDGFEDGGDEEEEEEVERVATSPASETFDSPF
ncbi:hypothetical protein FRB94_006556 [Tulasnella sp. JGI-2019a]|nr:hypothetical protein FRB94_006556 [Tulasnella sp. JGI-2019a]